MIGRWNTPQIHNPYVDVRREKTDDIEDDPNTESVGGGNSNTVYQDCQKFLELLTL